MPIYIVRWPAFNVSLVRARDEEELQDILDEEADPGGCRWDVYKGPLWINFDLPVKVADPVNQILGKSTGAMRLKGVSKLFTPEPTLEYKVSTGGSDTRDEMLNVITKWAFPRLHKVWYEVERDPERSLVVKALRRDLVDLLKYAWRRAQVAKRSDQEGLLLQYLGLTSAPPWFRRMMNQAKKEE